MQVAGRTGSHPGGEFVGDSSVVQALALVSEVRRDGLPARTVPGAGASDRMGHLVQEHLVNLVVFIP